LDQGDDQGEGRCEKGMEASHTLDCTMPRSPTVTHRSQGRTRLKPDHTLPTPSE
jgi:hypothetical protein